MNTETTSQREEWGVEEGEGGRRRPRVWKIKRIWYEKNKKKSADINKLMKWSTISLIKILTNRNFQNRFKILNEIKIECEAKNSDKSPGWCLITFQYQTPTYLNPQSDLYRGLRKFNQSSQISEVVSNIKEVT